MDRFIEYAIGATDEALADSGRKLISPTLIKLA